LTNDRLSYIRNLHHIDGRDLSARRRFLATIAEIRIHSHSGRCVHLANFARDPAHDRFDD
jgi:hypothetical protein